MNYIIREFNKESGQLVVEYEGKWTYAIDLPVEDNAFPVGEKLENIIQGMAPVWLAERESSLNAEVSNIAAIEALVQPIPEKDAEERAVDPNMAMWTAVKFEQDVAAALVKFGLLQADPTSIPVSEQ